MTPYCKLVFEHYRDAWSTPLEEVPFNDGPIWQLPFGFTVLRCPPHAKRKMWTYATQCMSEMSDSNALELHMFSKTRADDLAELLVAMAHYHRTAERLGLNHTVNFGRPWLPNSACDHGLISLPYLDGPKLEWMDFGPQRIRFLWVVPISRSERDFCKAKGVSALEERFEEAKFDYADPFRPAVA
jgi:hypothetical protein